MTGHRWDPILSVALAGVLAGGLLGKARATDKGSASTATAAAYVPELAPLVSEKTSELRTLVERYLSDRAALLRRHSVEYSPARRAILRDFYRAWRERLEAMDFASLTHDAQADYVLLQNRVHYELKLLEREEHLLNEAAPLVPFAPTIIALQEARRRLETLDPAAAATTLAKLAEEADQTRKAVEAGLKPEPKSEPRPEPAPAARPQTKKSATRPESKSEAKPQAAPEAHAAQRAAGKPAEPAPLRATKTVAHRAANLLVGLRRTLEQWFRYYAGYDPLFTWWAAAPYKKADEAIQAYHKVLRERLVGAKPGEDEPIVGDPIGRDELLADLAVEMIPYSPEELIAIAQAELAWCEQEIRKAAREMGLGDDWKAALERVKQDHVEPGRQPDLIRDLAFEAIEFVEKHELVTVPPLARDIWRMEMLSPERQKESPFFLGGEVIQVSFPTDTMAHEDKLMSMRGNNRHFARATVHHELIPGHHLQGFMSERYNPHRRAFATPFWGEGWAYYFEMIFWDRNFPRSPENKIGMLFWRMHRAARIIFSLGFHLGRMTPEQCVDFLVDRVGHERANATAEVRRSFAGNYAPLYQVAYMIGGQQFYALRKELVESGKMTDRQFHDAVLRGNRIPVEMVRVLLTRQPLSRDYTPQWRFAGALSVASRAAP